MNYGEIVRSDNLQIGTIAFSPWYNDSEGIKDALFMIQNDQMCDIILYRRDDELKEDVGTVIFALPVGVVGQYTSHQMNQRVGYSFRVGVRNTGGAIMNNLKLRCQLFSD
jgi:hypothetical protein